MIYADFNGIFELDQEPGYFLLDLTGYGTLAYLSTQRVRLHQIKHLSLGDADGLQVIGAEICFLKSMVTDRCSGWFAKFLRSDIHEGTHVVEPESHPCFNCQMDLKPFLDKVGRNFNEHCPNCGTSVMYPLLPPGDASSPATLTYSD